MSCRENGLYFPANIKVVTLQAIIMVLNIVISLFGIVANGLIIAAYLRDPPLRRIQNTIFLFLAITDISATAFAQPVFVVAILRKLLGDEDCLLWSLSSNLMMLFVFQSLVTIVILSLQTFVSLAYPYQYLQIITKRRLKMAVAFSWGLVITATIALEIHPHIKVNLYFTVCIVTLTIITVVFTWIWTYRLVARHRKAIKTTKTASTHEVVSKTKLLRSTITALAVVSSLLGCYFFGVCFILFGILLKTLGITRDTHLILSNATITLMYLNSFLNPCLVFWRSSDFREAVKNMFN